MYLCWNVFIYLLQFIYRKYLSCYVPMWTCMDRTLQKPSQKGHKPGFSLFTDAWSIHSEHVISWFCMSILRKKLYSSALKSKTACMHEVRWENAASEGWHYPEQLWYGNKWHCNTLSDIFFLCFPRDGLSLMPRRAVMSHLLTLRVLSAFVPSVIAVEHQRK